MKNHEHIFVLGPTGVGKSYVASALAQKACRDGYAVYYTRAAALFRDLNLARADGSLRQLLKRLNRIDVLVVDDWAMAPMAESERRDFWEIAEDRYQTRSMILTSQLPVSRWHEQIGDPTLADGILDRLVHNAHRIEMRGESMRKQRNEKKEKEAGGGQTAPAVGRPSRRSLFLDDPDAKFFAKQIVRRKSCGKAVVETPKGGVPTPLGNPANGRISTFPQLRRRQFP